MSWDGQVAIVGAGVVGSAIAHALARRGVGALVLEAENRLGLGSSGANSGILHTGFDSSPGELETRLILRSAELREEYLGQLGVPVKRCGARLRCGGAEQIERVEGLARGAARNGVRVLLERAGELVVPGESVTDPALLTSALASAAAAGGAVVRLRSPVRRIARAGDGLLIELHGGERITARAVVSCAGLHGDAFADGAFQIYPRKGEFLVFDQPAEPLEEILLALPSSAGKGVLVFPTVDGHVIAGPTARDRSDKDDWTVESDARELLLPRAREIYPPLQDAEPIAAYAGLRPAGRDSNYVIEPSQRLPGLVDVAAIRSTGLSAAFGIGEHVVELLSDAGWVALGPERVLRPGPADSQSVPWWQLAAARSRGAAGGTGA